MTTQQYEELAQKVADIAKAQKTNSESMKESIEAMVKAALGSHPGVTPVRTMEFGENRLMPGMGERRILSKMPKELQAEADHILLASKILGRSPKSLNIYKSFRADAAEFIKALDSTTAGGVDEWVPTDLSPDLEKIIRLELKVAALFPEIQMPTNPFQLPIQVGKIDTFGHAEQTADTGQTKIPVGDTSNLSEAPSLTAKGHASRVLVSREAEEDSIVALLPFLREELGIAMAEGREDGIVNGDTAGTHEDTDTTASNSRRKLWLGLRATSNDQGYTRSLATFNTVNLRSQRADMGKYGVKPANLVYITGIKGYIKMLGLAEVVTVDKYGTGATVLSGELAKFDGISIVVSEFVREDLNASAIFQSGQTKTVLHLAHRRGHMWGNRRGIEMRLLTELYAESDQNALITKERKAFRDLYPIASNRTVNTGINFAT